MKSYLHCNTLEKWTLAHKIGYIEHIDLIPCRWIFMDLQYLQFVPCLQTEGLTDGRWTLTDIKSIAELRALSCAKDHVCTQCRNENIWKNTWNTWNPMGNIITSCDLNIGHSDLNLCMLLCGVKVVWGSPKDCPCMITALGLQWLQFVPCLQTDGLTDGRTPVINRWQKFSRAESSKLCQKPCLYSM